MGDDGGGKSIGRKVIRIGNYPPRRTAEQPETADEDMLPVPGQSDGPGGSGAPAAPNGPMWRDRD